ncbi:MAG: hypothetical protein IBX46_10035 [Desulfuromonadales bacterium]|nr:hypothetical protein [Desulfuromonadales bacterium]
MKIATKLILFGVTSAALLFGVVTISRLLPDWMNGVQGPFICFFLGYCGIIIVAQAFSFIEMIRRPREKAVEQGRRSGVVTGSA